MKTQIRINRMPGKILFLTLLFCLYAGGAFSQLSGTYTIGAGGDYETFTAAANDIHTQGVSGPVTFNVSSGIYDEQFTLDYIPNSSETMPVTFQSATGDSTDVVIVSGDATYSDNYVVKLKRLTYVYFKSITFKTTNPTYSRVVLLEDYADHLSFSNCVFEGVFSNQNNYKSLLSCNSGVLITDIKIENNRFFRASDGIQFNCSGQNNLRPQISSNEFDSIGYTSIALYTASNANISENKINGGSFGLRFSSIAGQSKITKNHIINISGTGMDISSLQSSMDFEAEISNNEVAANKNGSTGIKLNNSYGVNIYHNSILVNRDYYTTKALWLTNCGSLVSVANNNLISEHEGYAMFIENSNELRSCDNNNYYTPGRALAFWDDEIISYGVECEDLRTLKAISGKNENSTFAWPGFESDTVLMPRSAWIDNTGKLLMMNDKDDIEGVVRSNPPDVGCYEFTASDDVKPPLAGTIIIGSGAYATLQDVIDDARIKGISDSLKIQFPSGTYNMQCVIPPITGASSQRPLILESATGNAGDVTIQYDAAGQDDNYILRLEGSSFLKIRNLTFKALDDRYCLLFDMEGMLDSLMVNSCYFYGKPINQSGTDIITVGQYTTNFHYMEFSNNTFFNGGTPLNIYLLTPPSYPGNLVIRNNTFRKSVQEAMNLSHIGEIDISYNTLDSTGLGIAVRNSGFNINNNKIVADRGDGILVSTYSGSSDNPGHIFNNFVSVYNSYPNGQGIRINNCDTVEIYYNSVYINPQADPYSGGHVYSPLYIYSGENIDLRNNIFFNKGTHYSANITSTTFTAADNNCFYSEGDNLAFWDADCSDLQAIKDASGMNGNSIFANPIYVSPVDLHAQSALLDSAGVYIPGITKDIDGENRNLQYPDIGADEFGGGITNEPPVAVNDSAQVVQGNSVAIPVLENDSDPNLDAIHVSTVGTPAHGSVNLINDTIQYQSPQDDFTGMDSLIYHISDAWGLEDSAWVFVNVVPPQNHPPVAENDNVEVFQGNTVKIYVLDNDSDPDNDSIYISAIQSPVHGIASYNLTYITYQAPNDFAGLDSMQYFIQDVPGHKDSAWVFITVKANAFDPADIELDQLSMGSCLWADCDMDGDMDILTGGVGTGNTYQVKIYVNEGGTFTTSSLITDISPMQFDAVAWGDFDNDGDPDLIVAGHENTNLVRTPRTRLFRNENGQLNYIISGINMNNNGSVDWGDFDNDGDIDLLTGGNGAAVYRNDGPGEAGMWVFTQVKTLPEVREGSAKWGDYDGDGDFDILLSSTMTTGEKKIWLYRNDGNGEFTEINTGIENVNGRCIWFDYNHDGYPDIVFEGRVNDVLATNIYRNDPDNQGRKFTNIGAGLKGLEAGSLAFCDYDLDGDADLLITGTDDSGKAWSILYDYTDNGQFVESEITLPGVKWGNGQWGDYNGDGKPDLLLMGFRYDPALPAQNGAYTGVFVNNAALTNTPPTLPSGLTEEINGTSVTLSWSPSTDEQSYARALTYNIRLGTHSGGPEVISAMADPSTGALYVAKTGNIGYQVQWKINNLQLGRQYYWSVEAVDPAYAVSGFPEERSFVLESGFFSENPLSALPGLSHGDADWGDYDNDGDPDLAMTGKTVDGNYVSVIYRNNNGHFTDAGVSLQGVWKSSLDWGDYDNDGDLDLIIAGRTSEGVLSGITKIYRNDGNNTFTDLQANLLDVSEGDVAWGDYDNDGDLDVLICGRYTEQQGVAGIFRNDDGAFNLDMEASMAGVSQSSAAWYDYDGDGDQDILIAGMDDNGAPQTKVYKNDGGVFTENQNIQLPGIYDGTVAWLDYDNDDYPDILISGNSVEEGPVSMVYRNDGNGNFYEVNTGLDAAQNSTLAWGDMDCDGSPDIVIGSTAGVFLYLKNGGFSETVSLPGIGHGAVALADYNGDRRLDLLLTGLDDAGTPYCKLYYNSYSGSAANHAPETPEGLTAYNDETGIIFQWQKSGDWETGQEGLSYNLRIGTTPGGSEIMASMADPATGYRLVAQPGNTSQGISWKLTGLEENTTYYWSVQAVDPGFLGSAFAAEQSIIRVPSHTVSGDIFLYSQTPATEATVLALSINDEGAVSHIVSTEMTDTNTYEIREVPEGLTTIKVLPGTAYYVDYLPTYLGSTAIFDNADMFYLDQDTTVEKIYLVHKPQRNNGNHHIGGFFIGCSCRGDGCPCIAYWHPFPSGKIADSDTTRVTGVYVYLLDSEEEIVAWAVTDSLGYFSIDSIPGGTYTLYFDFMGLPVISGNETIVFDEDNPEYKISAIADETGITVSFLNIITALDYREADCGMKVFPNPVHDYLDLRFGDTSLENVTIRIIRMDGIVCKTIDAGQIKASGVYTLPVTDLKPGVYILSVDGREMHYKTRIIKLLH